MNVVKYPGLSGLKKLGIFCYTILDTEIYEVYVVDVDLDKIRENSSNNSNSNSDYKDIYPVIRFEGHTQWGGCFFDSSFYIFEGDPNTSNTDEYSGDVLGKSVKKFNLSSVLNPEIPIGIEQSVELRAMNHPKQNPIAVVTPDGKKILVFSSTIGTYPKFPPPFELYDPVLNEWDVLETSGFGKHFRYTNVLAYTFIDQFTFRLETQDGVFFLDVKPSSVSTVVVVKERHWKNYMGYYCQIITINRRFVLTPTMVIKLDGFEQHMNNLSALPVPNPVYHELDSSEPPQCITFLGYAVEDEDEDGQACCYTLVSQTQTLSALHGPLPLSGRRSSLLIDVCHIDLDDLNATVVGTLYYIINGADDLDSLRMFLI